MRQKKWEYCKFEKTKSKKYYIEELIKSMQLKMQDETLPMAASKTKYEKHKKRTKIRNSHSWTLSLHKIKSNVTLQRSQKKLIHMKSKSIEFFAAFGMFDGRKLKNAMTNVSPSWRLISLGSFRSNTCKYWRFLRLTIKKTLSIPKRKVYECPKKFIRKKDEYFFQVYPFHFSAKRKKPCKYNWKYCWIISKQNRQSLVSNQTISHQLEFSAWALTTMEKLHKIR